MYEVHGQCIVSALYAVLADAQSVSEKVCHNKHPFIEPLRVMGLLTQIERK